MTWKNINGYMVETEYLKTLTFGAGRKFQIGIYSAFNAGGIIGSEKNGIVIFDDDNANVILANHKLSPGGGAPTDAQKAAFNRIAAMNWTKFSVFCVDAVTKLGASPKEILPGDIRLAAGLATSANKDLVSTAEPSPPNYLSQAITARDPLIAEKHGTPIDARDEMEIFEQSNADEQSPYKFALKTREGMIAYLGSHESYYPMSSWNGGFCLSWDIKAHNVDMTGKAGLAELAASGYSIDPQFDERWNQLCEKRDLFSEACSDAASEFVAGDWTPYPGGDYGFAFDINGRSGGHLVLKDWPGAKPTGWRSNRMTWESRDDFVDWLQEASDKVVAKLYRVAVCLDYETSDPSKAVSRAVTGIRAWCEETWVEEAAALERAEDEKRQAMAATLREPEQLSLDLHQPGEPEQLSMEFNA